MLEKLLRARLPEQFVALIEKLEQDPDTSHLQKVEWLLDSHEAVLTRYERWALQRAVRKCRNVIRREKTLNRAMRIVINEPVQEIIAPQQPLESRHGLQGAGMSLRQHGAFHQAHVAQIQAQQARDYADALAKGYYTDARSLYNGSSQ